MGGVVGCVHKVGFIFIRTGFMGCKVFKGLFRNSYTGVLSGPQSYIRTIMTVFGISGAPIVAPGLRVLCGALITTSAAIRPEIGIAGGILTDTVYTSLVLVILTTIIIAPILLKNSYGDGVQKKKL